MERWRGRKNYMGPVDAIATLIVAQVALRRQNASCLSAPEQGIRRGAGCAGLITVGFDPDNFSFKQVKARRQLVLRIRPKIFAREAIGCVP